MVMLLESNKNDHILNFFFRTSEITTSVGELSLLLFKVLLKKDTLLSKYIFEVFFIRKIIYCNDDFLK